MSITVSISEYDIVNQAVTTGIIGDLSPEDMTTRRVAKWLLDHEESIASTMLDAGMKAVGEALFTHPL